MPIHFSFLIEDSEYYNQKKKQGQLILLFIIGSVLSCANLLSIFIFPEPVVYL
jgi:hypothetical protein